MKFTFWIINWNTTVLNSRMMRWSISSVWPSVSVTGSIILRTLYFSCAACCGPHFVDNTNTSFLSHRNSQISWCCIHSSRNRGVCKRDVASKFGLVLVSRKNFTGKQEEAIRRLMLMLRIRTWMCLTWQIALICYEQIPDEFCTFKEKSKMIIIFL